MKRILISGIPYSFLTVRFLLSATLLSASHAVPATEPVPSADAKTPSVPSEVEEVLRNIVRLDPHNSDALAQLGILYCYQGRYSEAVQALTDSLQLNPHGPFAAQASQAFLYARVRLPPAYLTIEPPPVFTETQLKAMIHQKLSRKERLLAIIPFMRTPAMEKFARRIVLSATNDESRAHLLFEALITRTNNSAPPLQRVRNRTAAQAFEAWQAQEPDLYCQDYSLLFVALARAVGLKAFVAYVDEEEDGALAIHGCAAVFLGEKAILVDPVYLRFGVHHPGFLVLNDLQMVGLFLSGYHDLEHAQIACKLAPDLPMVQLGLLNELLQIGHLNEARATFRAFKQLCATKQRGRMASSLALLEARTADAVILLKEELTGEANEGAVHLLLAEAYAQQGNLDNARKACQETLDGLLSEDQVQVARYYITNTTALKLWGLWTRAFGMLTRGEWDEALKSYEKVLELNPGSAPAYYGRAIARQAKGELDGALADYREAIRRQPDLRTSIKPLLAEIKAQRR
ncbi:MAG: hypothetical protein C5B50_28620 [Verrucomicrobia bacterium]|nr:MAG: hypothetical protein C5B50_28620 [Verrucomicrobiota bacterium]